MAAGWDDDSGEPFPDPNEPYHQAPGPNLVETWEEFLQGNEADSLLLDFVKDEDLPLASKTVPMDTILFRARIGWESEEYGTRTSLSRKLQITVFRA